MPKSVYQYGERTSGETHGVVLTKPHVVELILDLAGYTPDRDLPSRRLLEPACGHGAFLVPAILRLVEAAERLGLEIASLEHAISAFDIDPSHVALTREVIISALAGRGVTKRIATSLRRAGYMRLTFSWRQLIAPSISSWETLPTCGSNSSPLRSKSSTAHATDHSTIAPICTSHSSSAAYSHSATKGRSPTSALTAGP